jgi:acyl dehydratase
MPMEGYTLASVNEFIGRELGVSDWITVDQERINQFADCTGDHQWIHVDVERAQRESPFGGTVAHGYLTLSLLPAMQYSVGTLPDGVTAALNYGADKVRFINPVKAGARIRDRITLVGAEDKDAGRVLMTTRHTIEIEGEEKPAMVADTLAMLMS